MTPTHETEIDLSHYLDLLLRRRWVVISIASIVFLSAVLYTFTRRPVYQASALLIIEKERGGAMAMNGTMVDASDAEYYQTQYKLLQSDSLIQTVFQGIQPNVQDEFPDAGSVRRAITVSPVLRTRLVYVRAESGVPARAALVANTLAETFVKQNLSNQLFISKEVLAALETKGKDRGARKAFESLPAVVNNNLIQRLKEQFATLESREADLSSRYTALHPTRVALRANLETVKRQIETETDRAIESLQTELSGQLKGNNVRIIDPAQTPGLPIRPNKKVNLLFGLLAGLGLGVITALLLDMLDQSVRTQEDVERKLHLPFLGIVPHTIQDPKSPVFSALLRAEPSLTSEAMRNLRTMIDFARVSDTDSALLITSSVQEEGKTYTASNLAVVFAQLGESVLLIDGDLRRPKLHHTFGLSASRGISEYLAKGDRVEDLEDCLQDTAVANLKLLVCGPRPPNPSELLNTPRVGALLAWAKSKFDRVLVDCPPIFPISDTLLWGRHAASAVFVVRSGKTRAPLVLSAKQRLETGGVRILGVAINGAKPGGLTYSSYGYYYQQYYRTYQDAEPSRTS